MISGKDHVIEFSNGVSDKIVHFADRYLERRFPAGTWETATGTERFFNLPDEEYIHVLRRPRDLTFVTANTEHAAAVEELFQTFGASWHIFGPSVRK